eukprot:CAMPEP_0185844402 /NCGR_PEP_ID=MMETSP1354-20130828/587_1 /TAXON_ID=708628 /ORGANISM="Erythrolobus madagascarensis, Strain CCMP3276" /LENGTH=459 /DNA_ID=CAMNT_0028544065 /DNA_START=116 /DNA_END=1495 /DNA_ORIENTATION=+
MRLMTTVLAAWLVAVVVMCVGGVGAQGDDLTPEEVTRIKAKLEKDEQALDEAIGEVNVRIEMLKAEHVEVESLQSSMDAKHAEELQARAVAETELAAARLEVDRTREQIASMTRRTDELNLEISSMESVLKEIEASGKHARKNLEKPSLATVIDASSQRIDPGMRSSLSRLVHFVLVPALDGVLDHAEKYRSDLMRLPGFATRMTQLLVYGVLIFLVYLLLQTINHIRVRLARNALTGSMSFMSRVLLLCDCFCAAYWLMIVFWHVVLWCDPFAVLAMQGPTLFHAFQLCWLIGFSSFVSLRIANAAMSLDLGAVGELLSVIIVGYHHYVNSWAPSMGLSAPSSTTRSSLFYYVCYAWMFCAFSFVRIQELLPLKQVRGQAVPLYQWVQLIYARILGASSKHDELFDQPVGRITNSRAGGNSSASSVDTDSSDDDTEFFSVESYTSSADSDAEVRPFRK